VLHAISTIHLNTTPGDPQKRKIAEYLENYLELIPNPYKFLFLVLQAIYAIHLVCLLRSIPPSRNVEIAEYLKKTIENPIPKPYKFLFLMLQAIYAI
jgi:AcrR family transcriptional regulator